VRTPLARLAVVLATAAATVVLAGSPASAEHPCYENEPCEGHWCLGPSLKPPFLWYPC
jgi:hypothetical protein